MEKKIFLASSNELKDDREQFELFVNRKNKEWYDKNIFLELVIWEDFFDAVSSTRSQDEYNKKIEQCDIFVFLFFSKVGQYSEEEFDKAFERFKATGKPLLFTYFKNTYIKIGDINNDVLTLLNFKKKLSQLEQFYSVYENIDQLKFDFNSQLEQIIKKGLFGDSQHKKGAVKSVLLLATNVLQSLQELDNAFRIALGPLSRFDHNYWSRDRREAALKEIERLADTEIILPRVRQLVAKLEEKAKEGSLGSEDMKGVHAALTCGQATLQSLGESSVTPWPGPQELGELMQAIRTADSPEASEIVRQTAQKVMTIVDRRLLREADELLGRSVE